MFPFSSSFICSRFSTTCITSRKRNEQRHVSVTSTRKSSSMERWWKRAHSGRVSALEEPWVAQSQEGRLWVLSDPTCPTGAVTQLGFLNRLIPPLCRPRRLAPHPGRRAGWAPHSAGSGGAMSEFLESRGSRGVWREGTPREGHVAKDRSGMDGGCSPGGSS